MSEKWYGLLKNKHEKVERRLINDGFDVLKVQQFLQNNNIVIAGSYVLQAVTDQEWRNSDIDFWLPYLNNEQVSLLMSEVTNWNYIFSRNNRANLNYFSSHNAINVLQQTPGLPESKELIQNLQTDIADHESLLAENRPNHRGEMWNVRDMYTRMRDHIIDFIEFTSLGDGPKIQLIITRQGWLPAIDTFDLNICQVYYNGKDVIAKRPAELVMQKASEHIQNSGYYIDDMMIPYSEKGKRKFMEQAYKRTFEYANLMKIAKITKEASELQTINEWYRTLKRIIKYVRRGYDIDWTEFVKIFPVLQDQNSDFGIRIFIYNWNETLCTSTKYWKPFLLPKFKTIPLFYGYYKDTEHYLLIFGLIPKLKFTSNNMAQLTNIPLGYLTMSHREFELPRQLYSVTSLRQYKYDPRHLRSIKLVAESANDESRDIVLQTIEEYFINVI